jgi:hypothetical protein
MSNARLRPSFSVQELELIKGSLEKSGGPFAQALAAKISLYLYKVQVGVTKPTYVTKPTIEQQLGMEPDYDPWEALLVRWKSAPDSLTASELSDLQNYRMEKGLMSEAEEAEWQMQFMCQFNGSPE